jgi:hypothetical protein
VCKKGQKLWESEAKGSKGPRSKSPAKKTQ